MPSSALPFAVHSLWHQECRHRWARARMLLLVAFVLCPVVIALAGAVSVYASVAGGLPPLVTGSTVILVVPAAAYLMWFYTAGRPLVRTRHWSTRVVGFGCCQFLGTMLPAVATGGPVALFGPSVTAPVVVVAAVSAHQASLIMLGASSGAPAATDLPLRHKLRTHPRRLTGEVTIGIESLSWYLKPQGVYGLPIDVFEDGVRLADVTDVQLIRPRDPQLLIVAPGTSVPEGLIVRVDTTDRQVHLAPVKPHEFATQLELRTRLSASSAWSGR